MNQFERAKEFLVRALIQYPQDVQLLSNCAICYILTGQKDQGRALLEKAVALDPNFVPAVDNLRKLNNENL